MKLYATITSERGKKLGKGGNDYIMVEIGDGERNKLAELSIRSKNDGIHIYATTLMGDEDQCIDYFIPKNNGEKQKEKIDDCVKYGCIKNKHNCVPF